MQKTIDAELVNDAPLKRSSTSGMSCISSSSFA